MAYQQFPTSLTEGQLQIITHPGFWAAVVVCLIVLGAVVVSAFPGKGVDR